MAIGSKELASTELDTFEDERLVDELKKAKEELFNLRFQSATGQLESHGRLRAVKRDIARIYTVIRERELGILRGADDGDIGRWNDELLVHAVGEAPVAHLDDDVVARRQLVEPVERLAVGRAVAGDGGVAELPRHR